METGDRARAAGWVHGNDHDRGVHGHGHCAHDRDHVAHDHGDNCHGDGIMVMIMCMMGRVTGADLSIRSSFRSEDS